MLRQLRSAEKMKKVLWIGIIVLVVPSLVAFYGFGQGGAGTSKNAQVIATIDYPEGEKGEHEPDDVLSSPETFGMEESSGPGDSYKQLSLAELHEQLQNAVQEEDYEKAAKLRDEISKRESNWLF